MQIAIDAIFVAIIVKINDGDVQFYDMLIYEVENAW